MPLRPVTVTRRSLVGAVLLGTAGGCSLGPADPDDPPTYTPPGAPDDVVTDAPDPDAALVDDARAALSAAHRTAQGTARSHPRLAGELTPLARLHRGHVDELGGLLPDAGRPGPRGESDGRARRRVLAVEDDLQQTLVTAAVQADSGALAQLLASMAAAVAQHRSVL